MKHPEKTFRVTDRFVIALNSIIQRQLLYSTLVLLSILCRHIDGMATAEDMRFKRERGIDR